MEQMRMIDPIISTISYLIANQAHYSNFHQIWVIIKCPIHFQEENEDDDE